MNKPKKVTQWNRLDDSPKRSRRSSLGRLTSVDAVPPQYLTPLTVTYERISRSETIYDPETGESRKTQPNTFRRDSNGERIPKAPKQFAFGAWDIESHAYEHTCSAKHQKSLPCNIENCEKCDGCPACNEEHGDHWIAAQLSILRIPDPYIDYVANLDESQMFGGIRSEGGRYVEFLNGGQSLLVMSERARCIAVDGCIDRTLRFLMAHPCFFQKSRANSGYIVKGEHKLKCQIKNNIKSDNTLCTGCVKRPYAPGFHTPKCQWERDFRKKDGSRCEGCMTLSTIWYSHFGGGYDINFALRWLSNHGADSIAIKDAIMESPLDDYDSPDERYQRLQEIKRTMEKRYEYKAESILAGATHIQVKLNRLTEEYKKPKPTKKSLLAQLKASVKTDKPKTTERPGTKDYWLNGFLNRGLAPSGDLCSTKEAQETLKIVMKAKILPSGIHNDKTDQAIRDFQKKCNIPATGIIDRETSAALRYLRSQTTLVPDKKEAIVLRDSFRLVPSSLEAAAKDFNLVHPVTKEPLRKLDDIDVRNPPPPDDPEYRRYCRIDTEICVQLVTVFAQLITQELKGSLEMTASACAMALFRRQYLKEKVPRHRHFIGCKVLCPYCGFESCSKDCGTGQGREPGENLEKHQKMLAKHKKSMHKLCPTYPVGCFHFTAIGNNGHRHGGHVDVLKQKLENGRCYDVNSLYPYVMLGPVPTGQMTRLINLTPKEKKRIKSGAILNSAHLWDSKKRRAEELGKRNPGWQRFIDKYGIEFAALEAEYQIGADRSPSKDGKPFDDYNFDRVDSFKRIRRCGYVEAIVSIPPTNSVPGSYFPPLPIVREEILFWPVGSGIYSWWCYEELRAILEIPGAKLIAVRQSVWFRGEPLFRGFIETLYDMRSKSEGAMKQLLKILMNSTYGKTLQNPLKRKVLRLQLSQDRPPGWLPTNPTPPDGDDFSWPWGTVQEYRETQFFLPQWGSIITARARMVIWRICVDIEKGKYGKDKQVAYLDSISKDRTVVVQSPSGRTVIAPVEELWNQMSKTHSERGKEFAETKGWKALAMNSSGNQGWFPLQRLVRHQVSKDMWLISNKQGQTQVTEDHGIMASPVMASPAEAHFCAFKPKDFVVNDANFIKLKAPSSTRQREVIDLMEFIQVFRSKSHGRNSNLRFEATGDEIRLIGWGPTGRKRNAHSKAPAKSERENDETHKAIYGDPTFKRYYAPGSRELHALLRIMGAYISEGSASFPNKSGNRWLFTISQQDRSWLEDLQDDLKYVVTNLTAPIYETARKIKAGAPGSGMFAIRSGAAPLCCFFDALCGHRSDGKRLPEFVYDLSETDATELWNKLVEGDGHILKTNQVNYTTKSQQLMAGISYMLDQMNIEHTTYYRPDKQTWSLFTRPTGSERKRKLTNTIVRKAKNEWVYDLTVQGANTFVDGIGRVLLHNTDSCYTNANLEKSDLVDDKELGKLKLEYQLTEDKRLKFIQNINEQWKKYQADYEANVAQTEKDETLTPKEKTIRIQRLNDRLRYFKKEYYTDELKSTKYNRARPDGRITCEFYGPKLYIIMDPTTGEEVKAVHKGAPEPSAAKLRRFVMGGTIKRSARPPKAGVGIRDDFAFIPEVLERTGRKFLWNKPAAGENEISHKRVHHHDPRGKGNGATSPRYMSAHENFELEESFRSRRVVSASDLYKEWTGEKWPEKENEQKDDVQDIGAA